MRASTSPAKRCAEPRVVRASLTSAECREASPVPLFELDPRVDGFVGQIGQQVSGDSRKRDVHGDRLDHGKVRTFDGQDHFPSDAWYREKTLDQENAQQQPR